MDHELVKLFERSFVKQKLDPLARGHLAGLVLLFHSRSPAALFGLHASLAQDVEPGL
jgi:hypothetical protein